MADLATTAQRSPQLAGHGTGAAGVSVTIAPPAQRLSLRARPAGIPSLEAPLGMRLPLQIRTTAVDDGRHLLKLGPDEWLIIDESGRSPTEDLTHVSAVHSAVDVSHRNVGFIVEGPRVEDVLAAGCPLDLDVAAFPVGSATRTVFGKIEIVLYRTDAQRFRLECWRSFAPYALALLEAACRDA